MSFVDWRTVQREFQTTVDPEHCTVLLAIGCLEWYAILEHLKKAAISLAF